MTFFVENEAGEEALEALGFDPEEVFRRSAAAVLQLEGVPYDAEIGLTLVDREAIRELNREHRSIDRETDVLSFPLLSYTSPSDFSGVDPASAECFNPDTNELMLGDIVLCVDVAVSQAKEYGHSIRREFAFLIIHSMLHLLGYDHMEDKDALLMEERQRAVLDFLDIKR